MTNTQTMPVLANPGGKAGVYQTYRPITEKYADIRQRMAEKVEVVPELAENQPEVIGSHYDVPIFALYRKERKGYKVLNNGKQGA